MRWGRRVIISSRRVSVGLFNMGLEDGVDRGYGYNCGGEDGLLI